MVSSLSSPIEAVDAALQSHNPFAQPPFVNANNIWGPGFPDLEFLNAHASDAVFRALDEIQAGQYPRTSILITAQNGTGKSHIISRIRHRLQAQGGALFVYASKFNDLNQIKPGFQQLLADSLSNIGSQGVKQWQELATAMANDALKSHNPSANSLAPKDLVKRFEAINEVKAAGLIHKLTSEFCKFKSVKDPDIVRAIFWTLLESEAAYTSNWLGGKELAQFKANELRLPSQKQSFDAILQILDLISDYNKLVICFDELDYEKDCDDKGWNKAQIVAGLVKELFDNLNQGVILTVMMPGIWDEQVKQLPPAVFNRVTAQGKPYELNYLNSDSAVELVKFFLKNYYDLRGLIPPHPVYPFDEVQLRAIGQGKPTVREMLQWCQENCQVPDTPPLPPPDEVEIAFTNELSEDISNRLDDNYFLADALLFGFELLIGQTIEGVTLQKVTTRVKPGKKGGSKDDYLNFKVEGTEADQPVSIGVAVLQYDGGGGLGAGFKRLRDDKGEFGLTRGCLVRSKNKPINSHFRKNHLEPLIQKGGEFVDLKEEEIKPLVAILSVFDKRESDYQVSEEQIGGFIADKGEKYQLGSHNPLLKEILSTPSYQVPTDLPDEPEVDSTDISDVAADNSDADLNELTTHE
ncbi:hypothetical protein BST81_18175 [Leptolyngbya sp. 'hensonii']|uniref:AAA family ATPase n=1 Tax=Leptolyngbya sp. 'hensonii' TaxID=1922337 RepID=UPI00094FD796|nr:AAA family ATPase [Leptolyngbya sp. 'hensonii']OLP16920.1 hypothetical protein BST81_18175 [Leptolyngbya sp. 'hensonii']